MAYCRYLFLPGALGKTLFRVLHTNNCHFPTRFSLSPLLPPPLSSRQPALDTRVSVSSTTYLTSSVTKLGVMSSYTPHTDLWLERARLDGMVLGGVSYGVFFLLTVQVWIALMRRPRYGGKIVDHRRALLFYIFITFVLRTISFAAGAKYTEMIWIDLRDAPGGPAALIEHQMNYQINVLAIGQIQAWFMQALLLHRCFVIWNWARCVMIPMITLYVVMIALSIFSLIQANTGAVLYKINIIIVYLCFQVGLTMIYTILVANRLLVMRSQMKGIMAQYDSSAYQTVVLMIIESSLFTLSSLFSVQGISQLFIILRVARGRAVTHEWLSRVTVSSTVVFAGTDTTEKPNDEQTDKTEQVIFQPYSATAEVA
ncbi:hypothetical protein DFH29DRAFT_1083812 [Suillus ampliporus]|nr:hypothetical protein DFH29DRAFT_1083812 [Suillus ampliporus]